MDLEIGPDLWLPAEELREFASRASGPGGQHVNKTSTRVTLRWNVVASDALDEAQRARLLDRLASRLTRSGDLVVHADKFRSRARNRELARQRIADLVRDGLRRQRSRTPTRPTRGSQERRRADKSRRADVKRTRGRIRDGDD